MRFVEGKNKPFEPLFTADGNLYWFDLFGK